MLGSCSLQQSILGTDASYATLSNDSFHNYAHSPGSYIIKGLCHTQLKLGFLWRLYNAMKAFRWHAGCIATPFITARRFCQANCFSTVLQFQVSSFVSQQKVRPWKDAAHKLSL